MLINKKEELNGVTFPYPYIQKLRKDGYDGRGVLKIRNAASINEAFEAPSLVEQCIDFKQEIAVMVARNTAGEIKTFPMVDMDFNPEANLVEYVFSPSNLSSTIQEEAETIAIQIAKSLQLVGVLAVEFFVTKDDQLLVNELAPRPHNSAHQSIEGNYTSQFEQHIRAIFNLPLGDTQCMQHAVMINLLGEAGFEGIAKYEGLEKALAMSGVYIHLYGKKFTKPFRKMGHVTILAENRALATEKAKKVQALIKVKA